MEDLLWRGDSLDREWQECLQWTPGLTNNFLSRNVNNVVVVA